MINNIRHGFKVFFLHDPTFLIYANGRYLTLTSIADQCIASAANLNLPPLPPDTDVVIRRRQIAVRLGVIPF